VAELEEKITRKNEVLSELMEEHVALKKVLGKPESGLGATRYTGFHCGFYEILVEKDTDPGKADAFLGLAAGWKISRMEKEIRESK